MKTVKVIKKDSYVLTHEWYFDDWGLKRNFFDLFHEPSRIHYPFIGMLRVSNWGKNSAFEGDDVSPYTDKQYQEMLDEQINHQYGTDKIL